ncbi:T9SS type A sorting domain-containing protein [candidate division GN15 bacterium]|nr:T9SS type A sorting domain-containing protein [candidate division GN15 bacterium]
MGVLGKSSFTWGIRLAAAIGLLAGLMVGSAVAGQPTLVIDRQQLQIEADGSVSIDSWGTSPIGLHGSLPVKTVMVQLRADESVDDIRAVAGAVETISYQRDDSETDIPTTAYPGEYDRVRSSAEYIGLGRRAVTVVDEVEIDGIRYGRVLVTPVYVDSGWLKLAGDISLAVGGRELSRAGLHEAESIYGQQAEHRQSQTLAGSGPEFVIVTSEVLETSFERLAAYRRTVGVETEILVIDDVLAANTGRDDAERLREGLKLLYDDGVRYVLLGGDETVIPVRYAYHMATSSQPALANLQVCDLYYADLTGEWDVDNDGIWGEPYHDDPDQEPELFVGRLPVNSPDEVDSYVDKLIGYETNPGDGDAGYLDEVFFYSSDQMRDWGDAGQHGMIAQAYPAHMQLDTLHGVEAPSGIDESPTNASPDEMSAILNSGHGIVNILAHGSSSGFVVRASRYNEFPKVWFSTVADKDGTPGVPAIDPSHKPGFYYSLACSNGGFDRDQPPLSEMDPNLVQTLLTTPAAGAIGFVAYSRWGWVGTSHYLQREFFDSLFAHPDLPAVAAMYAAKREYFYYRDLVYGQNYFGDPTARVFVGAPSVPTVAVDDDFGQVVVSVMVGYEPLVGCTVVISKDGEQVEKLATDDYGQAVSGLDYQQGEEYVVAVVSPACVITRAVYAPGIVSGVEDDAAILPKEFALHQNYPNPFNPTTEIRFSLPSRGPVRLDVINVLGQVVTTLVDEELSAGEHTVTWRGVSADGASAASGVYLYRLATLDQVQTRKMMLVK